MKPEQIAILSKTFEKVSPLPRSFGRLFYDRLFELDPNLRELFKGELDHQASMLVNALVLAVMNIEREGRILKPLRELGARHHGYGVSHASYDTFGKALLWALEQRLGDAFTPEVRDAWAEAYLDLATAMKLAADEARAATASV